MRTACVLIVALSMTAMAQMVPVRLDGAVTNAEIDGLLHHIAAMQPAASNEKNAWAYGPSGQAIRALGLIYRMRRDPRFVDQMVRFCDAELAERNDLAPAPVGQNVMWTGRVDPAWPNDLSKPSAGSGGAEGDLLGNLGNCAVTILSTRELWRKTVPAGDPHHFGTTYRARALTYVAQSDYAIDHYVLASLLDMSRGNHQYFAAASPYKGGSPVPWNQVMMFNYGFQMLARAHVLLDDDAVRAERYHAIVADNIRWFFDEGCQKVVTKQGRPTLDWGYALPSQSGEDSVHGRMDVAGLYLAYLEGGYPVGQMQMTALANTLTDRITLQPGLYAGRVDGTSGDTAHAAATKTIHDGFLFLAEFRPDAYDEIVSHAVTAGKSVVAMEGATVGDIDLDVAFLWAKHRHDLARHRSHVTTEDADRPRSEPVR